MVSLTKDKAARPLFSTPKARKNKPVPEWRLQAGVVSEFHRWEDRGIDFAFAGDMNGVRLSPSQAGKAKLTGMTAGETDLRFYLPGGRLKMIELKAGKGSLSVKQRARHSFLRSLGFEIEVVKADSVDSAISQCVTIVNGWLGETVH